MNKVPKLREPRGPIVQQVRDLFLEREYKPNPGDFYEQDIRLIENMDFLLQRFVIMQRKKVDESVKMVANVLRWRKEKRLYDLKESDFPAETALFGAAFIYDDDKYDNRMLYMKASACRNCAELKPSAKDYLSYLLFKIDDPKEGSTFSIVMDLTKASWSNYDLDLMIHFVSLLKEYFPVNLDYVLAINFPWVLTTAWAIVKRMIPAEKRNAVQFIEDSKIFDFIDKENVPDFLGGTSQTSYQLYFEECPSACDFLVEKTNGEITAKRLKEILTQYSDVLPQFQIDKLKNQIEAYKNGTYVRDPKLKPGFHAQQAADKIVSEDSNNNNNELASNYAT